MKPLYCSIFGSHSVSFRIDIASIIMQQSFFVGEFFKSFVGDSKYSARKPGSHLTELDHLQINDGFGRGIIDLTYWYAFAE